MDDTLEESVNDSSVVHLDYLSSYAANKGVTREQAEADIAAMKPRKLAKKQKRHRKDIKECGYIVSYIHIKL